MKHPFFCCVLAGWLAGLGLKHAGADEPEVLILAQDKEKKKDVPKPPKEAPIIDTRTEVLSLPPSTAPEMLGDVPPLPALIGAGKQNFFQLPNGLTGTIVFGPGNQATVTLSNGQTVTGTISGGTFFVAVLPGGALLQFPLSLVGAGGGGSVVIPRTRGFKVSDNGSAMPQDRVFVSFNFYNDLYASANSRLGVDLRNVRFYRETFGLEKTLLDGDASIELRLPIDTLSTEGGSGLGGSDTAVGDLAVIFKYVLWEDVGKGDVFSGGLAVVTPTGPDGLGVFRPGSALNSVTLQPYVGFLLQWDRFWVQGFSEIDVPTDSNDVTLWYNDLGIGYWVYRNTECDAWLSGIAPTFEVHVSTPLNHRGLLSFSDPAGTPDYVTLSYGINIEFNERTRLAVGLANPITGPRPFDTEVMAHLRWRY